MAEDRVSAATVIDARAEAIFAVLADPAKHAGIDGTGWVGEAVDREPLSAVGQISRMSMYHPNHPYGTYQMANRVQAFDAQRTIACEPGNEASDGTISWVCCTGR